MTEQIPLLPLLWGLCASAAGFALLWPLSVLRRDAGLADLWWGPGFAVFAWTALAASGTQPGPHGWAALGLATLWSVRLGWALSARRLRAVGEDGRYAAIRAARGPGWWWRSLFQVFVLQALIQAALAAPLAITVLAAPHAPGPLLALGAAAAILGFAFEAVADRQLDRWQAAHPGTLCTGGLRAFLRHPNYAGEILFWTGIALIGLEAGNLWAPATPAALALLLGFVSGRPMIEDRLSRHSDWAAYAARTPAFVPGLRPRAPRG